MDKIYPDARAALAGLLQDGMTVMSGGFGLCGIPEALITAGLLPCSLPVLTSSACSLNTTLLLSNVSATT